MLPGQRVLGPDELGRRSLEDHPAAVVAAARPQVDHPVGAGDDIEVVLDDDHRPTGVDKAVEQADQGVDALRRYIAITQGIHQLNMFDVAASLEAWRADVRCAQRAAAEKAAAEPASVALTPRL